MTARRGRRAAAALLGSAAVLVAALAALLAGWTAGMRDEQGQGGSDESLRSRLANRAPWPMTAGQPCPWAGGAVPAGAERPLVLLILGQSNAGNHGGGGAALDATGEQAAPGAAAIAPTGRVTAFDGRACRRVADPLPGASGRGLSIWTSLEAELARLGRPRQVVVSVLAVESTTLHDWVRSASPLRHELDAWLAVRGAQHYPADFVIWQQGEADARAGTPAARYVEEFEALRARLRDAGVRAPILLARSTRCRSGEGGAAVHAALATLTGRHADVRPGADTDALVGSMRHDDCHFTTAGLQAAARAWAAVLTAAAPARGSPGA